MTSAVLKSEAITEKTFFSKVWNLPIPVLIATLLIATIIITSFLAPLIAPYHYADGSIDLARQAPSSAHIFGTDIQGRDLLSRMLYGGRVSMSIALITAMTSVLIGIFLGTLAGYMGGWIDRAVLKVIDTLYTLPSIVIMILVIPIATNPFVGIIVALSLTGWLGTARLMRAQVFSWKNRPFVEAAHALGLNPLRIIFRHIMPNCIGPIIVELSYQIPTNILAEAFLSYLGIGVQPPIPTWGSLADEGKTAIEFLPHLSIFPGLAIFVTMLSFNILGDHLRDRLDPALRGR
jgi:oligopeptide transport system permease protein